MAATPLPSLLLVFVVLIELFVCRFPRLNSPLSLAEVRLFRLSPRRHPSNPFKTVCGCLEITIKERLLFDFND